MRQGRENGEGSASRPVVVRKGAARARPAPGEIRAMFLHRLLSVRASDAGAMLGEGSGLGECIRRLFADRRVSHRHLRNARSGFCIRSVVRV